ncbi:MAG: MFS transporter [Chloroflexi bacterium]|nr:MFS transporter [Chloroflexota bacterium]
MLQVATPLKLPWYPWPGQKRPFYGWVIVVVTALKEFGTGLTNQGFATYLGPLQQEFGWSRALLAGPRSITQLEGAALGPLSGWMIDRFGPRFMVGLGSFLTGLGLIMFGLVENLWMYYLANIIVAIGNGFASIFLMSVMINHWFRRKRSIANSWAVMGFPIAGIVGVPALVVMQTVFDWRTSAIASGLLAWVSAIPCLIYYRRAPEPYGLRMDGEPTPDPTDGANAGPLVAEEVDFTLQEALHTRSFWLLVLGNALSGLGAGAVSVHLFLHLEQGVGLERTTAAFVYTVASITNIPARLVGGYFGDRLPKNVVYGGALAMVALSQFVLGLATSLPMALMYAVLYGIGWGMRTPVRNALQGEFFGRRSQGVIRGWMDSVATPVTIAAPVISGLMADLTGDYRLIFTVMSFVAMAGAICIFTAKAPPPPVRH